MGFFFSFSAENQKVAPAIVWRNGSFEQVGFLSGPTTWQPPQKCKYGGARLFPQGVSRRALVWVTCVRPFECWARFTGRDVQFDHAAEALETCCPLLLPPPWRRHLYGGFVGLQRDVGDPSQRCRGSVGSPIGGQGALRKRKLLSRHFGFFVSLAYCCVSLFPSFRSRQNAWFSLAPMLNLRFVLWCFVFWRMDLQGLDLDRS